MANAPICIQRLLTKPPLLFVCPSIAGSSLDSGQPLAEDFPGSRINQVDLRTDRTSQRLEGSFAVFGWAAVLSWAVRDEALDVVAVHDGVNYGCLLNV